ncbi:MAG: hypothetical protein M0Z88_04820 [Actinomycetota bacterium]|nr:hypothetical protein [Actinomycetota bacterium]
MAEEKAAWKQARRTNRRPANSALVQAQASPYRVSLFHCPSPLPVNNPGVGTGTCGAMAAIYGGFSGHAWPSVAAAVQAVAPPSPPAACSTTNQVSIGSGTVATVFSSQASQVACEVAWKLNGWHIQLTGDLGGGIAGDGSIPWRQVATAIVTYLGTHPLPNGSGLLNCDIAPDGLHTSLKWPVGSDVYGATFAHGATQAISLAGSFSSYTGS